MNYDKIEGTKVSNLGPQPYPFFHVSIVLISLVPALSTIFILTFLSTRSILYAIPFIVTLRSVVVIGLKMCENKYPYLDVAQNSLSILVLNKAAQFKNHTCRYTINHLIEFLVG